MMEGSHETVRVWSGSIFSPIVVSLDGAQSPILPRHSPHSPLQCSQAHVRVRCKNRPDLLSQREVVRTKGPFSCQLVTIGRKHFGQCENLGSAYWGVSGRRVPEELRGSCISLCRGSSGTCLLNLLLLPGSCTHWPYGLGHVALCPELQFLPVVAEARERCISISDVTTVCPRK